MITREMVDALAALSADGPPVVSLYLDLNEGAPDRESGHVPRAEALVRAAAGAGAGAAAREELERVARYVRDDFARRDHRGLALFASAPRRLWQVHPLACPVRDRVVVDGRAYVRPLVQLLEENPPVALALADRESGHFFLIEQGELVSRREVTDDVPGRVRPGSWYGLADRRFERHVDECIHRHLKLLAGVLDDLVRGEPRARVLLGGTPDVLPQFERTLTRRVRAARVAVAVPNPVKPTPAAALSLVRAALRADRAAADAALMRALREGGGAGGLAARGLGATLDALYRDAVQTLAVGERRGGGGGGATPGVLCRRCGRLAPALASAERGCPVCGRVSDLAPVADLYDEMVDAALRAGADVAVVDGDAPEWERLSEGEGVAALLRFRPAPWEAVPDGHPAFATATAARASAAAAA